MSDERLVMDVAGLSMAVPQGYVVVQSSNLDGADQQLIPEHQKWSITVQVKQTRQQEATVGVTMDLIEGNIARLAPVVDKDTGTTKASQVKLLQRVADFRIEGCPTAGERSYWQVPNTVGKPDSSVRGYTVFKPSPTTFVVFELVCSFADFPQARAAYETAVATATFVDPTKAIEARKAALAATAEFIGDLGESKYAVVADGKERWFRLYVPAGTQAAKDDTELGYRSVKAWMGKRDDLDPESVTSGGRDNPEGMLVEVKARVLQRQGATAKIITVVDSFSRAFVSNDRSQEAWTNRTILRDDKGGKPQEYTETGYRREKAMSVLIRQPGAQEKAIQPLLSGTQYLSQAEVMMLPQLLVQGHRTGEHAMYAYRADAATISLRRDTIARDPAKGNALTLTTRVREDKPTTTSVLRDDGQIVRTTNADGSIWEPVDAGRDGVEKLWRGKNLPVRDR